MRYFMILLAVVAGLAVLSGAPDAPVLAQDKTIEVETDDPEMTAAIAKARGSLADFWARFERPAAGERDFALKVAIPYGSGADASTEHFWLVDIARGNGKTTGVISNDPNHATQVRKGQRYEFTEADISDWMFPRRDKIVGAETLRALFKHMPPEQAAALKARMETP